MSRHPRLGTLVDRGTPVPFRFAGRAYTGFAGDTLASALLAAGVHEVARSVKLGRPRGLTSAGSEEPSGLVQVLAPWPEPNVPATTLDLVPGLCAEPGTGQGVLAPGGGGPADARWAHVDTLVVGAGPAGLAAALRATRAGERVLVADERPGPGGALLDRPVGAGERAGLRAALAELAAAPEVRLLSRTIVVGHYDGNLALAVQRFPYGGPDGIRERLWRVRAGRVVLATGAHERGLAFAGNDTPGVMLAGAARAYLHRYGVRAGRRAVLLTAHDSGYAAAADLAAAGVAVVSIVDTRTGAARPDWYRGDFHPGHGVHGVRGTGRVTGVVVGPLAGEGPQWTVAADLLLVSGGWVPAVQLYSQAGGALRYDPGAGAYLPAGCPQPVEHAGTVPVAPGPVLVAPAGDPLAFVDLARDVSLADIARATGAGLRSGEHVKRYTSAGTGPDQAKTSAPLAAAALAAALGVDPGTLPPPSHRPPYLPVALATLAGRRRGALFDPVRTTALHAAHLRAGAPMELVGQWHRPRYFPAAGEDMAAAVRRECLAARTGLAAMDASTLGKIDVQGPDAGEFLDRLYTGLLSTLAVGRIRYVVMCGPDGMVRDDGTVARLAADRYLVTTTTGNAAAVLDTMREWSQTEWPHLRVWCTSVTEHWATVALVGPGSRAALAGLAPALAVSTVDFPVLAWRDAVVAGLAARVCRISFSGELAYEISVAGFDAAALWHAVLATGATPYGTQTMHVLRAEKGYPIVGQDTDGTVTPDDLGLGWTIAAGKADFVGLRSLSRVDTARADRRQFVALLPADPALLLPEGAALVAAPGPVVPPVPALGHVTSSYHSATLARTFALGLLAAGRARIGTLVYAPLLDGRVVPVRVAAPVLYDPAGARRDG